MLPPDGLLARPGAGRAARRDRAPRRARSPSHSRSAAARPGPAPPSAPEAARALRPVVPTAPDDSHLSAPGSSVRAAGGSRPRPDPCGFPSARGTLGLRAGPTRERSPHLASPPRRPCTDPTSCRGQTPTWCAHTGSSSSVPHGRPPPPRAPAVRKSREIWSAAALGFRLELLSRSREIARVFCLFRFSWFCRQGDRSPGSPEVSLTLESQRRDADARRPV